METTSDDVKCTPSEECQHSPTHIPTSKRYSMKIFPWKTIPNCIFHTIISECPTEIGCCVEMGLMRSLAARSAVRILSLRNIVTTNPLSGP